MVVRVRVRLQAGENTLVTSALVNAGFEGEGLDLAIPVEVARRLGLWPPTQFALEAVSTAGGIVSVYIVPNAIRLALVDVLTEPIVCNAIIDPHLDEIALCDKLIDALGIVPVSFGEGTWRHRSDPPETIRSSAPPEFW